MKAFARWFCCSLFFVNSVSGTAQDMTADKLQQIIEKVSDTVDVQGNSIRFVYQETFLICIYDENANRMRIISPIIERDQLEEEQLLNAMVANFHSALDVKYALSDEIIWSIYVHPLKELQPHQLVDAIKQVYAANATFGTSYSSTDLIFPGNTRKKDSTARKRSIKKVKI
ncbi:hypothetical protein [Maribacter sp. 2-571]|uniref:hypothetical protein n=1 Tax=Maribacter sp. 2-571 TaxID=3417569 RepID=UPI003D324935